MSVRTRIGTALLGAALLACGGVGDADEEQAAPPVPERQVVVLAEGEALAILDAVHQGAGAYARAAQDSVNHPELRRLLRVIRVDHEALRAELQAIADSLRITPALHPAAQEVQSAAQDAVRALAAAGRVDETVLRSEIELQETILTVLDSTLLPGTRQPLLAQYAAAARPTLGAHLQRARQIEVLLQERAAELARRPAPGLTPSRPATPATQPSGEAGAPTPRPTPPAPAQPRPDTSAPPPAQPDTTGTAGR